MSQMPTGLTPRQLIELRFKAQSSGDFTAIYQSSHRLSTLRRSFPSLKEYLAFAAEQLSDQIRISDYEILASDERTRTAYVFCRVEMSVQGQSETFAEVAEVRRSVLGWRFLRCSRLPQSLLNQQPEAADLKQLASHPEAIVY